MAQKRYTTAQVQNTELPRPVEAATFLYPNIIGQSARESYTDYSNPRDFVISVFPGDNIQDAIDTLSTLGRGTVLIRNGTHKVNYDIVLKSSVYLKGENAESAIIDFQSGSYQIKAEGSNAYSAGTVTVNNNSTTVTGAATSWLTYTQAGMYILLGGLWYPIANVGADTTITLAIPYAGESIAGGAYVVAVPIYDVKVQEMVIKNSATSALKFRYMTEGWCFDLNVQTSLVGIDIDDSSQISMNQCDFLYNYDHIQCTNAHYMSWDYCSAVDAITGHGYALDTVTFSVFNGAFSLNNAGDGMNLTSCKTLRIDGAFNENGGQGIEFIATNNKIYVKTSAIENNASDGVKLTATSDNCFVESSYISGNGGYGVNIAASTCDNTVVSSNNFSSNSSGAVNNSGTGTEIRGNIGVTDSGSYGLLVPGGSASDTLQQSADTERHDSVDAYQLVKSIFVRIGGTIRVKFDLKQNNGGTSAYARIYVDGVAVGTERQATGGTYTTFSEDITINPFSYVQLYAKDTSGAGADEYYVRNFRIYYTLSSLDQTTVITN